MEVTNLVIHMLLAFGLVALSGMVLGIMSLIGGFTSTVETKVLVAPRLEVGKFYGYEEETNPLGYEKSWLRASLTTCQWGPADFWPEVDLTIGFHLFMLNVTENMELASPIMKDIVPVVLDEDAFFASMNKLFGVDVKRQKPIALNNKTNKSFDNYVW